MFLGPLPNLWTHLRNRVNIEIFHPGMNVSPIHWKTLFSSVQLFTTEDDITVAGEDTSHYKPCKHDVISCLGLGGRWITSQSDLQVTVLSSNEKHKYHDAWNNNQN